MRDYAIIKKNSQIRNQKKKKDINEKIQKNI